MTISITSPTSTTSKIQQNGNDVLTVDSSNNVTVINNLSVSGTVTANGNINFDSNTLYVDATNNRVGIGTSSPTSLLTLNAVTPSIDLFHNGTEKASILTGAAGSLAFYTGGVFSGTGSERMRIDSSGNVGIGGTSGGARLFSKSSTTDNTTYPFIAQNSASSNLFFVRSDGYTNTGTAAQSPYNQTVGSAANTYIHSDGSLQRSTSSLKYKKNVQDATHGLQEVLQIRPITYESKNELESGKVFGGLIAEEIDAIGLTEFVQYAQDGTPDAIAYGNMVSLLTKAIQEQQEQIKALEARIEALENPS